MEQLIEIQFVMEQAIKLKKEGVVTVAARGPTVDNPRRIGCRTAQVQLKQTITLRFSCAPEDMSVFSTKRGKTNEVRIQGVPRIGRLTFKPSGPMSISGERTFDKVMSSSGIIEKVPLR